MPHPKKPCPGQDSASIHQRRDERQPGGSDHDWASEQLRITLRPPPPVPEAALTLLFDAACGTSGGSQAARSFLFWLAGRPDPTGYHGIGGLELRRMDRAHKAASLELLAWWAGPTQSDKLLYTVLSKLVARITPLDDHLPSAPG